MKHSIRQTLFVMACVFFLQVAMLFMINWLERIFEILFHDVIISLVLQAVVLLPWVVWYGHRYRASGLKFKRISCKTTMLITALGLCTQFLCQLANGLPMFFAQKIGFMQDVFYAHSFAAVPFYLQCIVYAIIPAVLEEAFFRGILFQSLAQRNLAMGTVISSAFFALLHFDFFAFPGTFVLGVLSCMIFYYTNSIFSSMLFHFIVNLSGILLEYKMLDNIWPFLLSAILFIPLLIGLKKQAKRLPF